MHVSFLIFLLSSIYLVNGFLPVRFSHHLIQSGDREVSNVVTRTKFIRPINWEIRMSSYDDPPALSLKNVAVATILVLGVFGTGFVTSFQNAIRDVAAPQSQTQTFKKNKVESENRGSMTRLTRREINYKLAQVPVFFASDPASPNSVFIDGTEGRFFINFNDATEYAKQKSLSVQAATLEDVYYPLVVKKAKIGSFLPGVATSSNLDANYVITPPLQQTKTIKDAAVDLSANDLPLFRIPNLAFNKEGIEVPLFVYREDAMSAFDRLQEGRKAAATTATPTTAEPTVQITSLSKLLALWESGGIEGRALEVYPGMEEIENARRLILKE